MTVRRYQDLIVWQKAMDLVMRVYETTESFPRKEMFGLTNQPRRAAISIPSNIAEGQARLTTKDFMRHLSIARGSLQELETQVLISSRLNCIAESASVDLLERTAETSRLLTGLSRSLSRTMCAEGDKERE